MTRPRLATGARLRYDDVREEHVLLVPEGAVRLNPTAAEVLVVVLTERYEGADLRDDVCSLVDGMAEKGLVVDAAT
jgi:pyrroloquinoline quinone biosynthesis protein D